MNEREHRSSKKSDRRIIVPVFSFMLIFALACVGGYFFADRNSPTNGKSLSYPPTTLGQLLESKECAERMEPLLSLLQVKAEARLQMDMLESSARVNDLIFEARLEDNTFFRFSSAGVLLNYGHFIDEDARARGTAQLTKPDMVVLAEKLLAMKIFGPDNVDGLAYVLDEENVSHYQNPNIDAEEASADGPKRGNWQMYIGRTYKGIKCLSMVRISASIETGEIERIVNLPFFLPKSLDENISKEEAVEIASESVEGSGMPIGDYEIFKEVTHIGDPFEKSLFSKPHSVLCWAVRFKIPEVDGHLHPVEVYVDCKSGKVRRTVS